MDHSPQHAQLSTLLVQKVQADPFDLALALTVFKPRFTLKQDLLVEAGKTACALYFVNKGYVRSYFYREGESVTTHLVGPGTFITAFNSFIRGQPSHEYVECLSECDLLTIAKTDLDALFAHSQKWATFGRLLYEDSLSCKEQRTTDFITLTAEQRYVKLLRTQPGLVQHVPVQYLASYLGIRPESLSRIRKRMLA
jgi:CRP-like cAMP-binding protein